MSEKPFVPTVLTRDELLVFNTMFFVFSEAESLGEVPSMMAAFERYAGARANLMEALVSDADAGIQRCLILPPENERH